MSQALSCSTRFLSVSLCTYGPIRNLSYPYQDSIRIPTNSLSVSINFLSKLHTHQVLTKTSRLHSLPKSAKEVTPEMNKTTRTQYPEYTPRKTEHEPPLYKAGFCHKEYFVWQSALCIQCLCTYPPRITRLFLCISCVYSAFRTRNRPLLYIPNGVTLPFVHTPCTLGPILHTFCTYPVYIAHFSLGYRICIPFVHTLYI